MTTIERAARQLVLRAGSLTLILDKNAGRATMRRKHLLARKPMKRSLSEIAEVRLERSVDPASGAEHFRTMLVMRTGGLWRLAAQDKRDGEASVATLRDFLGMGR